MSGLLLRLAGPLQSWGEHSNFSERDTLRYPTRSGITGILAAAQGIPRGQPLTRYEQLTLTVRIDRPGQLLCDYHTAGGGLPPKLTAPTADGGRRGPGTGTVVTRRWYLSDAVFTIAAEGPGDIITQTAEALQHPHWQPYLGRRACPPDQPLFLRVTPGDPVGDLLATVPLPVRRPRNSDTVPGDIITETPTGGPPVAELNDVPDHAPGRRAYRSRLVYQATVQVPARLAAGPGTAAYHLALRDYTRTAAA